MGSKRQLRPGVWELRVPNGRDPLNGKPKPISKTFHGGARAADKALSELEVAVNRREISASTATVGTLIDKWFEECERRFKNGKLAENTFKNYEYQVTRLKELAPAFLEMRLDKLKTVKPLEDLYAGLADVGVKPAGLVQIHKALRVAFNTGIRWGRIGWNPAQYVGEAPSAPKKTEQPPTVDEVKILVDTALSAHPDFAAYFVVGALVGLRRQALCGLQWPDFDLDKQVVTVNRVRNMVWGKVRDVPYAKGRHADDSPPCHFLDPYAVQVLQSLRAAQARRAEESGTTLPESGWVFSPDGMGLSPFSPDVVQRRVKAIAAKAKLPYTSHDLRHHRATELIAAGVDPAKVAAELDHRDTAFTMRTYVKARPVAAEGPMDYIGQQYIRGTNVTPIKSKRLRSGSRKEKPRQAG